MGQLKADLAKAAQIVEGNNTSKIDCIIHYVMNKESILEMIKYLENAFKNGQTYASLDLETTTFDYWRPETKVMCMALAVDESHSWVIPLEHAKSPWRNQSHALMKYLRPYFETKFIWVGNNWKYDTKWMRVKYGITVNFGPDNMLMSYANDENCPHDLKYQATLYFGANDYEKAVAWPRKYDPVVDNIVKKVAEYDLINLQPLMKYNALDAHYSVRVYPIEKAKLLKDPRSARIYKFLLEQGSKVFMHIEEQGMWIDPERLAKARIECQANVESCLERLNSIIPDEWCKKHLSTKLAKKGFNWNSPKQIGELFFSEDGFNFPVTLRTGTGAPSTSESVIIELASEIEHPALDGLLEYRKWAKYMNTYLTPWSAKLDSSSRIHPSFKLHGTVTGRLSGEDGVHQVPRDQFIRSLIGAPPGWSFFEIDGSQIELRVAAAIANEHTMLRIFATGGDIHSATGSLVTGKDPKDVTKDERKKAKAVNFGFLYGMGWKKFKQYSWEKYGIRLKDAECKAFRDRFFDKYSDLRAWHDRSRRLVRNIGYVVSPLGRKRRLPDIYSSDEGMQSAAEREAINSPVQGMGSDIILAAFVDIVLNRILKEDPNFETIRPVGAVHDAQYYEIRNDKIEHWAKIIKDEVDNSDRLRKWFGYTAPVQFLGDCKIGNHWGDAKDWVPGEPLPYERR